MLLSLLVDILFGLIDLIINLIPDIDISLDLSALSSVTIFFGYLDNFIDMKAVISSLGLVFLIINAGFIVRIFNFIVRKIPTIS